MVPGVSPAQITLPVWRIHRHVGMGGDQLVPALIPDIDSERHEGIEESRRDEYPRLIGEVQPLHGAHELIAGLKGRGITVVLARSSPLDELDRYLELLDAREREAGAVAVFESVDELRRNLDETPLSFS